jgi:AraC-like DNA-binding protein
MVRILEIIIASTGIINCLLVALLLFFVKSGNMKANRIFGVLLISICFKFSYVILVNFPHDWSLPSRILVFFSECGFLLFGPLLLYYVRTMLKKETNPYLVASVFLLIFTFSFFDVILNNNFVFWPCEAFFLCFLIATVQQLIAAQYGKNKIAAIQIHKVWLWSLTGSFFVIWIAVILIMINFELYRIELCLIFAILFYFDSYILVKQYWLKRGNEIVPAKYLNSNLTVEEENDIISRLQQLMEQESLYIDSELSLPKVAGMINVKPYKLSQVINQRKNMTFNEYINFYRVNAIKSAMKVSGQEVKIASIAGDFGFNSISSFNTAFKKFTNLTPTQYRNEYLMNNQN